ncbi:MAG: glucuronate isomerase [Clostridia bacterium]|nr:glucuronate isomerase [Clostridia bacterium]
MMDFLSENFLLDTEVARMLYFEAAKDCPIFDYHCHISPKEIYEDRKFSNITEIWLGGDHYKWRLLRSNGVPEEEITGGAPDYIKFRRFCELMPKLIGNPMYTWCHLELKTYFGFDKPLSPETCDEAWKFLNKKLAGPGFSARSIIKRSNVRMIGTTDDPVDDLRYHRLLLEEYDSGAIECEVCPSFRPDKALHIENDGFEEYIKKLSDVSDIEINSLKALKEALSRRIEFFVEAGMRASDHGLNYLDFEYYDDEKADRIFKNRLNLGKKPDSRDTTGFISNLLVFLGGEYNKHGVVMQLHYGAQRNVNRKAFNKLGPDTGFDCMSTRQCSEALSALLNKMAEDNSLPKMIIYSLNPGDNEMIDTVIGSFQGEGVRGRIQHGAAWWFNDTKSGIERHLESLANLTVLGNFVGMLTDSRSFLSYTRHDYFRRILCGFLGRIVEAGEYPADIDQLKDIVKDICYNNAYNYFQIN